MSAVSNYLRKISNDWESGKIKVRFLIENVLWVWFSFPPFFSLWTEINPLIEYIYAILFPFFFLFLFFIC